MRAITRSALATAAILVVAGLGFANYTASRAIRSEEALHAMLITLRLTNEYAAYHDGAWPDSWSDLEQLTVDRPGIYDWPEDSAIVRSRIAIDFEADAATLADLPLDDFDAIKPIGPCFPWRHYGCLEELQNSLRGNAVFVAADYDKKVVLSRKQAEWFIKDISGPGVKSQVSKYPAAANATFHHAKKAYQMHGNSVIHVDRDGVERLWTGPYLQALIASGSSILESIKDVEQMPDLSAIRMDAPCAYPGGGAAPLIDSKK